MTCAFVSHSACVWDGVAFWPGRRGAGAPDRLFFEGEGFTTANGKKKQRRLFIMAAYWSRKLEAQKNIKSEKIIKVSNKTFSLDLPACQASATPMSGGPFPILPPLQKQPPPLPPNTQGGSFGKERPSLAGWMWLHGPFIA